MNYEDFRAATLKIYKSRKSVVSNSYGIRDAYIWLKANNLLPTLFLEYRNFTKFIRRANLLMVDTLLNKQKVVLPDRFGTLEIRKNKTYNKIVGGKLKSTLPVDWKKTLELWSVDPQSRENKTIVRREHPYIYKVFYRKKGASYPNKKYFDFRLSKTNKIKIKEMINNDNLDAFLLSDEIYEC